MSRTRVFQMRQVNEVRIILGDNADENSYQVAVIKDFPTYYSAMDFMRKSENDLRAGKDVCFKDS